MMTVVDSAYINALLVLWGILLIALPVAIVVGIIKAWRDR